MTDLRESPKIAPTAHDLTGDIAGRFSLLGRVGTGGMGEVYRAQDNILKRIVAIKRMAPQFHLDERDRQRFLKEAQRASALNHPNIAAVYDVLEEKGEILLILEFIEGITLRERMKTPLTLEQFFTIAVQCCEGVAAAHEHRLIHGDLKPENIMITLTEHVKILDFGMARRFTVADPNLTTEDGSSRTATLSGTLAYMAPEILMQKSYDGRADLFSLGVVFHELLGGPQPFRTNSFAETISNVLHREPPLLNDVNCNIPVPLAKIISRMLVKTPAERCASADDVLKNLRSVRRGEPLRTEVVSRGAGLRQVLGGWMAVPVLVAILVALFTMTPLRETIRTRLSSSRPANRITLPQLKSVAVLPLPTIQSETSVIAMDSGLVENLTTKLSQLGIKHALQVISAGEVRANHVTTLEAARQEFGVNLALQVGLRQSDDLVRASYTLLEAKTGKVLAGETIEAPLADAFGLEDRVTESAARALGVTLEKDERRELATHGTAVPAAYNYYLQGRAYLEDPDRMENVESARTLFSRAISLDPVYGSAYAGLGIAYWWKYDLTKNETFIDKARESCSKSVDLRNAESEDHICFGLIAAGTGDYQKAVVEFRQAIERQPTNDEAFIGLANAYQHLSKLDEAERTYQRVISLRPQYPRGYKMLALFYLQQAQTGKAVDLFKRVVELAPDSYVAYSNLGAALLYQARYAEAIQPLEMSISIRPTFYAYTNMGTANLRLRQYTDAARAYEEAIQLDGAQYQAWGSLGDANYFCGQHAQARKAYQKAIQLATLQLKVNPKDAEVLGDLADYYAVQGDRKQALLNLSDSMRFGNGNKNLLFNAAVVYDELGETGVSLQWLKKALDAGFSAQTVREAPSFEHLKNDPGFQQLLSGRTN
jgi:eukaryotic-like serine/threonine-protein kinase